MPLFKICKKCEKRFKPKTRGETLCIDCWENSHKERDTSWGGKKK